MSDVKTTMGPTASVIDGILQQNSTLKKTKTAEEMNALGKDAFLQLLVCQMENQDPLEPTSDTEWISQLASFSSLEEMQKMSQVMTNSQALNLVGQEVILNTKVGNEETKTVSGQVDYVTMKGGKAYLSVKGELYPMDDLVSIIDYNYLMENYAPKVETSNATYDRANPSDVTFKVSMGKEQGEATAIAIVINDEMIPAEYVSIEEDGTVTIAAKAFEELKVGSYTPMIVFNDSFNTTSTGNFLLVVTDSSESGSEGDGTEGSGGAEGGSGTGGSEGTGGSGSVTEGTGDSAGIGSTGTGTK